MDRRSTFRFRLPWSQPAPAPSPPRTPSIQPNTKTSPNPITSPSSSPTTKTKTRNQPSSTTTAPTSKKPSSPARPSAGTQARNETPTNTTTPTPRSPTPLPKPSAETNTPSQPSTMSTDPSAENIPVPPQPSAETKAPIQASTTNSTLAKAPASPKAETKKPASAITTTPTSTKAQSPPSSPPEVAPSSPSQTRASRTESQPLIPPQEQHGITSQPASPSDGKSKSPVSHPPSPSQSRSAPQSQEMTPTSSPTGKGPHVISTDQLTSKAPRSASQTSSNLPLTQPASPSKQLQGSSEPNSKAVETQPSIYEKEPTPAAVLPQSKPLELQVKKATISNNVFEEKLKSPEKVMQTSELSQVKSITGTTEGPYQISDSSGIIGESKAVRQSERNIQETKVVKEDVQETRDKSYGSGDHIGGFLTSKEHPNTVFQLKQRYTERQEGANNNQMRVNPLYDGKKTRAASSQPKNKTAVSGPSQKTAVSTEPDVPLHNEIKDNISKFVHRIAVGNGKQNLEERPVSVITLAGDNRGASMQLGSDSSRKEGAIHIRRGYKLNPDESADATTDAEGRSEGKLPKDARTTEDQEIEAYLNCNVQGLNNSIIFDSSIAVKSPGIHMSLPHMTSEPMNSSDKTGALEAHKAEFNVTPSQKLTYKPPIRTYEGIFNEPSDSDPDDVGCMEKSKENEIDIL